MSKKKSLKALMSTPEARQSLADSMTAPLRKPLNFDGRLRELMNRPCVKCKLTRFGHTAANKIKHPFFYNNLEMLEYEADRRDHK